MKKQFDWIKCDINAFCKKFGFRKIKNKKDLYILTGTIKIIDPKDNFLWDTFDVDYYISLKFYITKDYKNDFEKTYPKYLPIVILKGHDSIKIPDRHIGEDGKCCLATDVESQEILTQYYTLEDFTNKLVIPFFASQVYYDNKDAWPFGDYKHYEEGLIQYYLEKLNVTEQYILKGLEVLSKRHIPNRNDICFCGSNIKYKRCHETIIGNLMLHVNNFYFRRDFKILLDYYNKTQK